MRVVCNHCSKEHVLPDNVDQNTKIFFYCTECAHKIVVIGPQKIPSVQPSSSPHIRTMPTFSNLFDAVPRFFSFNSFLLSLIFHFFALIIIALSTILVIHRSLFFDSIIFPICVVLFAVVLLIFGYNIVSLIISKIHYYRISHPQKKNIDWKFIFFDFAENSTVIFLFTAGLPLILLLLFTPIYFLEEYGITYSSILFVPLVIGVIILGAIFILGDYIPAIIALPSLSVSQHCSHVFHFVRREIVNIPFYSAAILFLNGILSFVIVFVISGAVLITFSVNVLLSGSALKTALIGAIPSFMMLVKGQPAAFNSIPDYLTFSISILCVFLLIIITSTLSILMNLRLALVAQSCWIMNENPELSISRSGIIIFLSVIFFMLAGSAILFLVKMIPHFY